MHSSIKGQDLLCFSHVTSQGPDILREFLANADMVCSLLLLKRIAEFLLALHLNIYFFLPIRPGMTGGRRGQGRIFPVPGLK